MASSAQVPLAAIANKLPPVATATMVKNPLNAAKGLLKGDPKMQSYTIALIVVVLLFLVVILYILFMIKSPKLSGKELISKPLRLDQLANPKEISNSQMPLSVVGREYSYSFWVYVDSYDQTYTTTNGKMLPIDKLVFYRGTAGTVIGANPVVFMDGLSNKMHIAIKTQGSVPQSVAGVDYNANLYNIRSMNYFQNPQLKLRDQSALQPAINKYLLISIDYVPLQRWVHVSFVVDNKLLTIYMDGEIYSVKSTDEYKALREQELDLRGNPIDVNVIVDKTDGNLYVGKNSVGNRNVMSGYLSRLQYYNFALPLTEVKRQYAQGPQKTGLFGLGGMDWNYGIRSPVYKLDEQVDQN
jgi:hypothetical protein